MMLVSVFCLGTCGASGNAQYHMKCLWTLATLRMCMLVNIFDCGCHLIKSGIFQTHETHNITDRQLFQKIMRDDCWGCNQLVMPMPFATLV